MIVFGAQDARKAHRAGEGKSQNSLGGLYLSKDIRRALTFGNGIGISGMMPGKIQWE